MKIKELSINEISNYQNDISSIIFEILMENDYDSDIICRTKSVDDTLRLEKYMIAGSAIVIGAVSNDNLIGFMWIFSEEKNDMSRFHINQIGVIKEYRNIGLGRKLIEFGITLGNNMNIDYIDLNVMFKNKAAIKLYKKYGFETEKMMMKLKLEGE